jgi:hypothetical protein
VALLRDVITAMGRTDHHEKYFIKFQSGTVPQLRLITEAFPDVPWMFIYRSAARSLSMARSSSSSSAAAAAASSSS